MSMTFLSFTDVARVLELIGTMPNGRTAPGPGDLAGDFDYWFDGGARKIVTGQTWYRMKDGTTAKCINVPGLHAFIRFPGGEEVAVHYDQLPRPGAGWIHG